MKTNKEMQATLKSITKRLDGSVHEMCSTRRRALTEAAKRDVEKALKETETMETDSEEMSIYLTALKDTKTALSSISKDQIDVSVDNARTKLNIGFYELKDLL